MKHTVILQLYLTTMVEGDPSFDQRINEAFGNATGWFVEAMLAQIPLTDEVGIPWVLIVLIAGAGFFTLYFKGINLRSFGTAVRIIAGHYDDLEDKSDSMASAPVTSVEVEKHHGEVSHFQALTAALSATVGLGNIAGVAIALSIGGPGATFWMILVGILGMASKFVECTLGVKYREIADDGTVYGGPMYYLTKGLKKKGWSRLGKLLAIVFAVMCIGGSFGGGNMFQVNQAFQLFEYVTGGQDSIIHGHGWAFGIVMAFMVGVVIIGSIKKIAKVTDKIVPAMVVVYVVAVIAILVVQNDRLPGALYSIYEGAFMPEGVVGGFIGVLIQGFRRAAFSNEAGIGSSAIAHSAVKTQYAASEGMVALLEPFIDTVVICTMTALVLIVTGQVSVGAQISNAQGVILTSKALESGFSWFPYLLSFAVILFAFSSMISWSYYGYQAWSFLFGRGLRTEYGYKIIFCICVVIGSAASLEAVIDFSDAMIFAMMVPNMIGLFLLLPEVKEEIKRYKNAIEDRS